MRHDRTRGVIRMGYPAIQPQNSVTLMASKPKPPPGETIPPDPVPAPATRERMPAEYLMIVSSGGGVTLDATRVSVAHLQRIVAAAWINGSRVRVVNTGLLETEQLCRIAECGKGVVEFVD
jgi:hypothetical protein